MKLTRFFCLSIFLIFTCVDFASAKPNNPYKFVVEGFDWGAAVNKVILTLDDTTSKVNLTDYIVLAVRKSNIAEIPTDQSSGKREVVTAYISDQNGTKIKTGKFITLVLAVGPQLPISSPIQYFRGKGNVWVDYKLSVIQSKTQQVWDTNIGKIMPLVDQFNLIGTYKYN